jgi:tRNA1(Val) A37 N6-methylase TrmN6
MPVLLWNSGVAEFLQRENQSFTGLEAAPPNLGKDVTLDAIADGRVSLYQPRKGHRAGTDAVLLAAALPNDVTGLALDVGSGVGTAGLILATRCPQLRVGLIENDPVVVELAQANLGLNNIAERGTVYEADIFSSASRRAAGLTSGMADVVLTNPPFADPDHARVSPLAGKRSAHVMPKASGKTAAESLAAWIQACLALLAPGGTFLMIHRPEALPDILTACGRRIGAVSILPVHSHKDANANRILVRGKKGSRAPLVMAPALVLQEQGRFRPLAEAIHRGTALIDW